MTNAKKAVQAFGLPRIIIFAFFLLLLVLGGINGLNVLGLFSDVLRRWGMYGVLVLAMVPGIQCGIGPNFGVTIGIVGGLLGALISIELRFYGFFAPFANYPNLDSTVSILIALALGVLFAVVLGSLYGMLLNKVKGSEMTVSTYVGFSIVAFFNILWLVLPFRSGTSIWPVAGEGLRNQINVEDDFLGVFDSFLRFSLGRLDVPTGLLLFFFLFCFGMWLFQRSRFGMMMGAAGQNPNFARAAGINVDKMRVIGTAISTALGAVGIICYAQCYGYLQLYNAPQMMGFSCVASVLIGGGSVGKARILNVILGAFLFHGILTVALPVANELLPGSNLSEVLRIIISNGIILYALSKAKGAGK